MLIFLACQAGIIHVNRLISLSVQLDFIKDYHSKAYQGDSVTHEYEMSKKEQYIVTDFQLLMSKRIATCEFIYDFGENVFILCRISTSGFKIAQTKTNSPLLC